MIRFKLYYDKDVEEKWLKEMSLKGWAFKKFFLGLYTFEPCEPGEYNYQIDLLDNWNGRKDEYKSFMEDAGVKVISQWWRWVYLEKKAAEGPFELYTDVESKITHYNMIKNFFTIFLILEFFCFVVELFAAIETGSYFYAGFTVLIGIICIAFFRMVMKSKKKIKQLMVQV